LPPSSLRPLHAEFISACSGRIIKLSLGLARTPFIFLEKNNIQKISKIILKNLWFSQIFFYSFCIISGCIFTL
jgi:hypothetical protein